MHYSYLPLPSVLELAIKRLMDLPSLIVDRNVVTAEEALLQTWKEVMLHKNLDRPALCFHSHSVSVRSHFLLKSWFHGAIRASLNWSMRWGRSLSAFTYSTLSLLCRARLWSNTFAMFFSCEPDFCIRDVNHDSMTLYYSSARSLVSASEWISSGDTIPDDAPVWEKEDIHRRMRNTYHKANYKQRKNSDL